MRALLLRRQRELVQILTDPAFAAHYRILGEDYKRIEIPEELHPALRDLYRKKSFYVEHNDGLDPRIFHGCYYRNDHTPLDSQIHERSGEAGRS